MSQRRIQLTRTTTKQFLDFLSYLSKKPMRQRIVHLTPRGDARLRLMEQTTGVSLTQMVNDLIKDYYQDGY